MFPGRVDRRALFSHAFYTKRPAQGRGASAPEAPKTLVTGAI